MAQKGQASTPDSDAEKSASDDAVNDAKENTTSASKTAEERPQTVADWVKYLSDNDLSVLASTLRELNQITLDQEAHVRQLSRIILRDPNLTSRVLKVANSAMYKMGSNSITTISRAIVVLGFSIVRDIAVSLKVMDSLLNERAQDELMEQLANSYHAAMQAKSIAKTCSPSDQEEVFIAALLRHVGVSAFLSAGGPEVDQFAEKVAAGLAPKKAAEKVLGFGFDRLTLALARAWSLGDLLTEVVSKGKNAKSGLAYAAHLGEQVSLSARLGWDSEEFQAVLKKVADFTGRSATDCEADILDCADKTRKQAVNYGAEKLKHLIPEPVYRSAQSSSEEKTAEKKEPVKRGDTKLQLDIIHELNGMVNQGKIDLNATLSMVMEGMHRGIGLDRVALGFVIAQKKIIIGKASVGLVEPDWERLIQFDMTGDNIFAYALRYGEPIWMGTKNSLPLSYLVTKPVEAVVGKGPFFIAPIVSGTKKIGVFYADNHPSQTLLTEDDYNSFAMFTQQTGVCLQALASGK